MDPKTVRQYQAAPYLFVGSVLAWLCGRHGAEGVVMETLATGLFWVLIAARYRSVRKCVSDHRREGDHIMAQNLLIAVVLPTVNGLLAVLVDVQAFLEPGWAAWTLAVPLLVVLLSSCVDWYVILPFRDGMRGLPVCCADRVDLPARRRMTKLWITHRLVCEVSIALALLGTAVLIALHYNRDLSVLTGAVSFFGGVGIAIGLAWKRWVMGGLRFALRQGPALGNWASGDTRRGPVEGFVCDVSLDNGVKVIDSPMGKERFIPLEFAVPDESDLERKDYLCGDGPCRRWLGSGNATMCDRFWRESEAEQ